MCRRCIMWVTTSWLLQGFVSKLNIPFSATRQRHFFPPRRYNGTSLLTYNDDAQCGYCLRIHTCDACQRYWTWILHGKYRKYFHHPVPTIAKQYEVNKPTRTVVKVNDSIPTFFYFFNFFIIINVFHPYGYFVENKCIREMCCFVIITLCGLTNDQFLFKSEYSSTRCIYCIVYKSVFR